MKKFSLFILALFSCYLAIGQSCDVTFYYYANAKSYTASQILPIGNDGFYLSFKTPEPSSTSYTDVTLIRVDALGKEMWRKTFGYPKEEDASTAMIRAANGDILIAGSQGSAYTYNTKGLLWRINANGDLIWAKRFNTPAEGFRFNRVLENAGGDILVTGDARSANGSPDVLVLKLDAQGNQLEKLVQKIYIQQWYTAGAPPNFGYSTGFDLILANGGGYLLTGTSQYPAQITPTQANVILLKLDENLKILWQKDYYGNYGSCYNQLAGKTIFQYPDGNIFVGVFAGGLCYDGGGSKFVIAKFTSTGDKVKDIVFGGTNMENMIVTSDGNFLAASQYGVVYKVDTSGTILWKNDFKVQISLSGANSLMEFPNRRLAFAGYTYANGEKATVLITGPEGGHCRNRLSGIVFFDKNGDCKYNTGDIGLSNKVLNLTPANEFTLSDRDGRYFFLADTTKQTIQVSPNSVTGPPNFWKSSCPASGMRSFGPSLPYKKPDTLHFALSPADICPVLTTQSYFSRARICAPSKYHVNVCNEGSQKADAVQVKVDFPPEIKFLSANFSSTGSSTARTFELGALDINQCTLLTIEDSIQCGATLGNVVCATTLATAKPICTTYQYDPTEISCLTLVNAYDPNDIKGWVDERRPCFPDKKTNDAADVEYRIRFQNTGNDTAYRVQIVDTLPADKFNIASLSPGPSSHPYNLSVRGDRVLVWTFDRINLPDSSTNEPASQGFVKFTLRTANPASSYNYLANQAHIYFDANLPIATNEYLLQKCQTSVLSPTSLWPPRCFVSPNPATTQVSIGVRGTPPFNIQYWYVLDARGQPIRSGSANDTSINLDVSNLEKGTYFVKLILSNGAVTGTMLVIGP